MGTTGLFLLQLLLTFLVGSTWIYLTVWAGTRFGSKLGGFLGGLPSTVVVSFFFIGFTQSPEVASRVTDVLPLEIGISGLFLVVYAWLVRRGLLLALTAALGAWLALSLVVVLGHPAAFLVNLGIWGLTLLVAFGLLEKCLLVTSIAAPEAASAREHLVARSLCGGFVIMLTVLVARVGGPVVGGVCAAFPAMFIATLATTYAVHGAEFSRALTKPLLVTGMITVVVYSIAVRYSYPALGLYVGTLVSILISAVGAHGTFRYVLPRVR